MGRCLMILVHHPVGWSNTTVALNFVQFLGTTMFRRYESRGLGLFFALFPRNSKQQASLFLSFFPQHITKSLQTKGADVNSKSSRSGGERLNILDLAPDNRPKHPTTADGTSERVGAHNAGLHVRSSTIQNSNLTKIDC